MPSITINGQPLDFQPGETILQVAVRNGMEIPHYCWHPGLSVVASCRICLAEVWAPNPRNDNRLEPIPKLLPTCQTPCGEGHVVYTESPKSIANQKAVMEYLLINHPVDCPVCDKAGECHLQDYSYQYGRGQSRFEEQKIKQPKKDLGPNVLLYSDRCIMCTRCVRFCREVTGTAEITIEGRGSTEQIDVFPGVPLDNELSANVIDLCPVGALLDKDFLFQQRVWFLKRSASIDGITASGDNLWIEHNDGRVYRVKPRENPEINRWWISDEIRYGWKFVHDESRLRMPRVRGEEPWSAEEAPLAYEAAYRRTLEILRAARRPALVISPMLGCEDAYLLARLVRRVAPEAVFTVGPVPRQGEDRTFPGGYVVRAEKAPNARGVRRVLAAMGAATGAATGAASGSAPLEHDEFLRRAAEFDAVVVTGNYPSDWVTPALAAALRNTPTILIDTLPNALFDIAEVILPAATWVEKDGSFESADGHLQAFDRAVTPVDFTKSESQIAIDMEAFDRAEVDANQETPTARAEDVDAVRREMAATPGLKEFTEGLRRPPETSAVQSDMVLVEL